MTNYVTIAKIHDQLIDTYGPISIELLDGCTTPGVDTTSGHNSYVSTGALKAYEPITIVESRKPRTFHARRRGYPPFGVTPWHRSKVTTRRYLTVRSNGSSYYEQPRRVSHTHKVAGSCNRHTVSYLPMVSNYCAWDNVTHEGSGMTYNVSSFNSSMVSDAIAKVTNDVSIKALTSYDFLTEIAEARELPGLVVSVSKSLLTIFKTLRGRYSSADLITSCRLPIVDLLKHPKQTLRRLGGEWMQYRYAIMPLVYSYRDIVKTINRGIDTTLRSGVDISPSSLNTNLPDATSTYMWVEATGSIKVRATVFQHYDFERVSRLAAVGMNPLVTAWELIPYSFVADWFVNMGDYITRTTSQNLAGMTNCCISRRENSIIKTWQHFPNQNINLTAARLSGTWIASELPPVGTLTISRPEESQLLTEVDTNSYTRWLFDLRDAQLSFKPSLNWRRMIDSAVMANNHLGSFIKIFKKIF